MKKKSVPCYVPNGGEHNIINVPMGQFVRLRLKKLVGKMLSSLEHFQTMMAIQPEEADVVLLRGLDALLSLNLKPKAERREAKALLSANEKNLKRAARENGNEEYFNLVTFGVATGLIILIVLLAFHVQYLELN